ncbi:MAG TPA: aldose epimerase family protein [Steroidobacteraceae bacterium]|jgi:aldose 1-epimerase|nr:aldose epimerase family protein [Steroidobacteraceae bacterium]
MSSSSLRTILITALCVSTLVVLPHAAAAQAHRASFGALANGTRIDAVDLTSRSGIRVRIITLGARIQSLYTPDRTGKLTDIVLGFDTPQQYFDDGNYFGATVGRFANRIGKGRFTLDGHTYQLAVNDHGNSLHGGAPGFDKRVWKIDSVTDGRSNASVTMSYLSPDGEEGYPGTMHVTATYTLSDSGDLRIDYRATTDKPTIVNMSGHSYFNLASSPAHFSTMRDLLQINASHYTPVNDTLIPTGAIDAVAGTPFDFRKPTAIGLRIRDGHDEQIRFCHGYDMNFVLDGRPGALRLGARVEDPRSGRVLEVYTTAPGLQFYSGNFLTGTFVGKRGIVYRQGDAVVLEPQDFPDAPNHPNFPSARLNPGATYHNVIVYRFSVRK